jgi:hypothetical protein
MLQKIGGMVVAGLVCVGAALAVDPDTASREGWRVQVDTNASTTVTRYTATKAGGLLSGKVSGSNAVWVATAAGTNGWVKIAQAQ